MKVLEKIKRTKRSEKSSKWSRVIRYKMDNLKVIKTMFVLLLFLVAVLSTTASASISVSIWGDDNSNLVDVQSKILGAGSFDAVDIVNIHTQGVPSLTEASAYDSILIFGGNNKWGSEISNAAGDVLADYADAGGGVVTATFVIGSNLGSWILHGRFNSDRYHVMVPKASQVSGQMALGTVYHPDHPLMKGVNSFDGGDSSYRVPSPVLTSGSMRIADWSNGTALVAIKELPDMGRRVDLNFYPPSSDVRSDFWNVGTDGDVLLANAVTWAIPEPGTICLLGLGGLSLLRRRRK